jgi:predicted phosphodiesterase
MIALLADIHGNREALTACIADAERRDAQRFVFLGDLIGYGADPDWVVDRVMVHAARGAIVLRGNHDAAATNSSVSMNETAMAAMAWTRRRLKRRRIETHS